MLGNIRRGAEGRKEARARSRSNPHICKKVRFAGMNGALIIYPGMLVRV